jgi:uncharacterized protein
VVVGGAGVYAMRSLGFATLHVKPNLMVAVPIGGLSFGVGMTLLGYCPGTGVAAAAEGRLDAIAGVAGHPSPVSGEVSAGLLLDSDHEIRG